MRLIFRVAATIVVAGLVGVARSQEVPAPKNPAPAAATPPAVIDLNKAGLSVGDAAPDAELLNLDGEAVQLASLLGKKPVVVCFYRGGWSQHCARSLNVWGKKIGELKSLGADVIFISPETPENARTSLRYAHSEGTVLIDSKMEAAKNFRVLIKFDEKTQSSYKGYGIDLTEKNAGGTWELPTPSAFVIDTAGIVRWSFADWDYKNRAKIEDVIKAVKDLTPASSDAPVATAPAK